jgi:acetolactate synthase-1/2/3 large subunit
MTTMGGSRILAETLKRQGVDTIFFLMGAPLLDAEAACIGEGIRMIDVRHEQAAAMMAHAWGRVLNRVGVCMAASGPGAANLVTGVANAWADAAPLVVIAGSSQATEGGRGLFQELDQVALFRPITKWAERVLDARRLPEMVATAMRQAVSGRPGPVYLDVPSDVLRQEVSVERIVHPDPER